MEEVDIDSVCSLSIAAKAENTWQKTSGEGDIKKLESGKKLLEEDNLHWYWNYQETDKIGIRKNSSTYDAKIPKELEAVIRGFQMIAIKRKSIVILIVSSEHTPF